MAGDRGSPRASSVAMARGNLQPLTRTEDGDRSRQRRRVAMPPEYD